MSIRATSYVEFLENFYEGRNDSSNMVGVLKTKYLYVGFQADASNCGMARLHNLSFIPSEQRLAYRQLWRMLKAAYNEGLPLHGQTHEHQVSIVTFSGNKHTPIVKFGFWLKDKWPGRVYHSDWIANPNSCNYIINFTVLVGPARKIRRVET